MRKKRALLINPWIYDFAAYDLWMRPLGLLKVASKLISDGYEVQLIDCLSRYDPSVLPRNQRYNCGKFLKVEVEKPDSLKRVSRKYYRYGIPIDAFIDKIRSLNKRPDEIYVASGMTFWYPGVFKVIELLKDEFPDVPIILGGIYATLCKEHAQDYSNADIVHQGQFAVDSLPCYELLDNKEAIPVQISVGCPFRCSYCASYVLTPEYFHLDIDNVFDNVKSCCLKYGVKDVAFYDDALLGDKSAGLKRFLDKVIREDINVNFHPPNGIHARFLDQDIATLMKKVGFKTIRLGFESSKDDFHMKTGNKVNRNEFEKAIFNLKNAGFGPDEIAVYTLVGFPHQSVQDVLDDIFYVTRFGIRLILASYSAIPGTKDWDAMVEQGIIDNEIDPLWHNNTIFSSRFGEFSLLTIRKLRRLVSYCNERILKGEKIKDELEVSRRVEEIQRTVGISEKPVRLQSA